MNRNWNIFLIIWSVALALAPFTILLNTPINSIFSDSVTTINVFQRLSGLVLFVLITTQVILGAFMPKWTDLLTGKIYRFHITEGIVAYILMFAHPILGSMLGISLLPVFTRGELLYNLGRLAFILFTIAVVAGLLRTRPFFMKHWRKFHILNYFAFSLIAVHSWFVGTDIRSLPFVIIWFIGAVAVGGTIIYKLYTIFTSFKT